MSDERLRELEHRWAATRDPVDEARLLVERRRTRALKRSRLELAAYLGHGPAIEALGPATPAGDHVPWHRWRAALDEAARGPLVQLTVAFVLGSLRRKSRPIRSEVEEAVEVVRRWVDCPCEEHAKASRSVAAELEQLRAQDPAAFASAAVVERAVAAMNTPMTRGRSPTDHLTIALHWAAGLGRRTELDDEERAALEGLVSWALGPGHTLVRAPAADEAAWLTARMGRGELTFERLEVAAYAGSEVARGLLTTPPERPPAERSAWVAGLRRWPPSWILRVLGRLGAHACAPSSEEVARCMLEGSDAARRRLLDIETRRAACIDLREWADHANRAPHGRLERLRALDGDPLVEAGETQERRRLLIAIMEHCAQKKLPDEPLIRRVLAFHEASQPPARSTVEQIVIDWALRYDAGSNGERTTVSAPGTP